MKPSYYSRLSLAKRREHIERTRQWQRDNQERYKALQEKYRKRRKDSPKFRSSTTYRHQKMGISGGTFKDMTDYQKGRCAICERKPPKLVLDHNHKTGYVRALLCMNCNSGIGMLQESAVLLRLAAEYLEHHDGPQPTNSPDSNEDSPRNTDGQ